MNSRELLDRLTTLTEEEEVKLTFITIKIDELNQSWNDGDNDYEKKDEKFVAKLQKAPEKVILKLYDTSEIFRNYCDSFRHPTLWQDYLKLRGFHGSDLPTLHGGDPSTNLEQYIGHFLFSQWNNSQNKANEMALLDKACKLKIFPALVARCDYHLEILKNNPNKVDELEGKILEDIAAIQDQYWAPGYMYSFSVFMNLAQLYQVTVTSEDDAPMAQMENHFYQYALACEMMAGKLLNHTTSQEIMHDHELAEWKTNALITDPAAAEDLVLRSMHIGKDNPIYNQTEAKVNESLSQFKI
jgi:hypothetical protein